MAVLQKKILILCPYPEGVAAGQRLKYEQYLDDWRERGYVVDVAPFMDMQLWAVVYVEGHLPQKFFGVLKGYARRFLHLLRVPSYDLVYVHMWVVPFGGASVERLFRRLARALVYDIEDNAFLLRKSTVNPLAVFLKKPGKVDYLIRSADHVVTSAPSLNDYCLAGNLKRRCTYISSSVDTDRFVPVNDYSNDDTVVIGWTGTFSSREYLDLLRNVFVELSRRCRFRLCVIGNFDYEFPGIDLDVVRWSSEREVEDLQRLDIGVYPLVREEWVSGKSGLKAIQYMAFGLPTVATAVGNTLKVIDHMETGLLVRTDEEWVEALERLIRDCDLRRRLGQTARAKVVQTYSTKVIKAQYADIIQQIA